MSRAAGRFERYLESHGHAVGAGLVIAREGARGTCAVADVAPAEEPLAPIRAAFGAAAAALAPGDLPQIAVLGGAGALLNDWTVRLALLGDPFAAAPGAAARAHPHVSAVAVVHEREHAADWLEQQEALGAPAGTEAPAGAYQWVEVFELHSLTGARPVPRALFAGRRDQWFGERAEGGYGFVATGAPAAL
jgi:hypothetical protein